MLELGCHVAGRLSGERGIARACPLPAQTVTRRARRQSARRIALRVKAGRPLCTSPGRSIGGQRHRRVVGRDRAPIGVVQLFGDVPHLPVRTTAVGIGNQLALEISGVQAGKPRGKSAVPFPLQPVASEAGIRSAGGASAEGDQLSGSRKSVGRVRGCGHASPEGRGGERGKESKPKHSAWGTVSLLHRFQPVHRFGRLARDMLPRTTHALLLLPLLAAACKPAPDAQTEMSLADVARGKRVIERTGCASCHTIPGIRWPRGKTAPALAGLDRRALIAGQLPNRPEVLAAFVRDAPALVPGTAMPAMPLSEGEALDVAAFLYAIGG